MENFFGIMKQEMYYGTVYYMILNSTFWGHLNMSPIAMERGKI